MPEGAYCYIEGELAREKRGREQGESTNVDRLDETSVSTGGSSILEGHSIKKDSREIIGSSPVSPNRSALPISAPNP